MTIDDLMLLVEEIEILCLGLEEKKEWSMLTLASKIKQSLLDYIGEHQN